MVEENRMRVTLRFLQVLLAGLVLAAFSGMVVHGKPEYTKKEKTPCITCHTKNGSKELNDVGKCYEKKKSLEECKDPGKK